MKTVAVLMSTYNGERFLREQIDSIFAQQGVSVSLYVRDDGSTDSTLDILKEYSNRKQLKYIACKNVGVGNSFMRLLFRVPDRYDYYAFADQDDVWLPEKLARAVECLEKSGKGLYASDLMVTDEYLNKTGLKLGYAPETEVMRVVSGNPFSGCTMVMTAHLKKLLSEDNRRPKKSLLRIRIHDVWVAAVATITDGLFFDEKSYILYRQHGGNVVGAKEKSKIDIFKDNVSKLLQEENRRPRTKLMGEIYRGYGDYITDINLNELYKYCLEHNIKRNINLVKNRRYMCCYTKENAFAFSVKCFLNMI